MSGGLRCPSCQNVAMRPHQDSTTQLEIDACPTCDGMWFDAHELATFLKSPRLKGRFLLPEASQPKGSVGYCISTRQRVCPRCRMGMEERLFAGITLDVCTKCQGFWFDAGEVRLVVDQFRSGRRTGDRAVEQELRQGLTLERAPSAGLLSSFVEFFKSAVSKPS